MLPFALKAAWFCISLTGIPACWLVLMIFSRAIGSHWGSVLYSVFATILQGVFCLGMIYDMNPFQMPKAFCMAQTIIIYYCAWSLTGICAAFTFATTSSVLWPSTMIRSASSTLAWHNRYYYPILIFPLVCLSVTVPVLLKLDAIQPTDDMHCDASHPVAARFLGYAGLSVLPTIPCFFMSAAAAYRVLQMHLHNQRSEGLFRHGTTPSHSRSPLSSERHVATVEFASPVHTTTTPLDPETPYSSESQKTSLPSTYLDDTDEMENPSPHVLPSPTNAVPHKLLTRWEVIPTTGNSDEFNPRRPMSSVPLSCKFRIPVPRVRSSSRFAARPSQPTNLAPAIWRLLLFQMAFAITQCLAALSTIMDVSQHRTTPTPFGTQHVALVLVGWGPAVVFGHLPVVRRQLMFWRRSG
ncbi:hypothetical protein BU15DRAFT_46861 [Melanogaster broomeanus]|nr:hypothetical protein BU15DRAFT_46861 [Melanogaster broomeanus]